jgi:hypothetical protein
VTVEGATRPDEIQAMPGAWETAPPVIERTAGPDDWLRRSPVASADLWPASSRDQEPSLAQQVYAPMSTGEDAPSSAGPGQDAGEQGGETEGGVVWPSSPWTSWVVPESSEGQASDVSEDATSTAAVDVIEPTGAPLVPEVVEGPAGEEPEPAVLPVAAEPPAPVGDALGRAFHLLDELRGLLPVVAGAAGVDLAGAIRELSAARAEAAALDGEALERAATAVAAARERPREIDALLGLSGNLDAVAAALAAHQRYAGAVERVIELLAGGSAAAQGPTASSPEIAGNGESGDW